VRSAPHVVSPAWRPGANVRELGTAAALGLLLLMLLVVAPQFFRLDNLRDLAVANAPVLIVAVGMTLVLLTGHVDISVGSQFAVCSVCAALLARAGMPMPLVLGATMVLGAGLGAMNGLFVARLQLPSVVVTLATMVIWRDGLRWATQGAWVQNLPPSFQWFGLAQRPGEWVVLMTAGGVLLAGAYVLRLRAAGRAVYAVGSDPEAARLVGLQPQRVVFAVFTMLGTCTALAAVLNSIRFAEVQANAGVGLEIKVLASVVVGGTLITGGRGTLGGTLVGVALLGVLGTALTFLGVNAFWEKAAQGAIILLAAAADALAGLGTRRVARLA
jgi:ribose/xylose/arabinose/galactoside ABC-type transport system permease subunit